MKFVFMLSAQHHLRVVKNAINHFSLLPKDIILLIQEDSDVNEITSSIQSKSDFGLIYSFKNWSLQDLLKSSTLPSKFIDLCFEIRLNFQKIIFLPVQYSDDSTILFAKIFQPVKIYLLDEGAASFLVLRKRKGVGRIKFILQLTIKSFLYKIHLQEPKSIVFLTQFDLKVGGRDSIEKYVIPIIDNKLNFNTEVIGILGTSIVELNMFDEIDYLNILGSVVNQNPNKDLFYYSHRKENKVKLEKIKSLGFCVVSLNEPFEIYFANQTRVPFKLISFSTSIVLFNLSKYYKSIPILEVYIIPGKKLKRFRAVSESINRTFRLNERLNFIEHYK